MAAGLHHTAETMSHKKKKSQDYSLLSPSSHAFNMTWTDFKDVNKPTFYFSFLVRMDLSSHLGSKVVSVCQTTR